MKLPQIKNEDFLLIALIAGGILYVFFFVGLSKPLMANLHANDTQRKEYVQEIAALKNIIKMAQERKSTANLIEPSKVNALQEDIIQLAAKNNVRFAFKGAVKPVTQSTESDYKTMVADGRATGAFGDIGQFLIKLSSLPQGLVNVERLVVSSDIEGQSNIMAQMKLVFYLTQ